MIEGRHPSLTKSFKGFFPFKIATTSFIYPDLYVPNVEMLGPFVDEIELLLFESAPVRDLMNRAVLDTLKGLSSDHQLTYNIHLPTDISITDPVEADRYRAVEVLSNIIERMETLSPTSYTLHLPYAGDLRSADRLRIWSDVAYQNFEKMRRSGLPVNRIAIETIDYPIHMIENLIDEFNFGICMDVGHLMLHGQDISRFFRQYSRRISIIHLHGVAGRRDHLSLDNLSVVLLVPFLRRLQDFQGTVSLEVFSFDVLSLSLRYLEKCWQSVAE